MKRFFTICFALIAFTTFAQERLYAPALVSPANNSIEQPISKILFDWSSVNGGVKYEVQIDTSAKFTNPIIGFSSYSAWEMSNVLFFKTDYNWRVRAIDASNNPSAWSSVFTFKSLACPVLVFPANKDITCSVIQKLRTATINGVDSFDIQYDTTKTFDSPFAKTITTKNFALTSGLSFKDTIYWRARATNAIDTSDWSDANWFLVKKIINIESPTDKRINFTPLDVIKITNIYGSTGCILTFSNDSFVSNTMATMNFDSTYTSAVVIGQNDEKFSNRYVINGDTLLFGQKYFMKTRLYNETDTSDWSKIISFTTIKSVNITYPNNNATNVPINPKFEWDTIAGTKYYILEYDTLATFATATKTHVLAGNYTPIGHLKNGKDYFLRVRSVTAKDTSMQDEAWKFKTAYGVGIENVSDKMKWSIYPNPTSGTFYLNIEGQETTARGELINLLGDVVATYPNLHNGLNTISIDGLSNGVYMMKIYFDNKVVVSRVVKK